MSERWYNKPGDQDDIILVSRIRLLRNFKSYAFPDRLSPEDRNRMFAEASEKLNLSEVVGDRIEKASSTELGPEERLAFKERMLINKAAYSSEIPFVVYASADESFSLTLNGTDHVRILLSRHGQDLSGLLSGISAIDDYIDKRMHYAFSQKLGFKTSTLANVGTGMRAYYVMHLPLLSEEQDFASLRNEIGRYGVVIKDAWDLKNHEVGGLYVLYNQRTLGLQEKDIIEILTGVSNRLMEQEREKRRNAGRIPLRDRVLRSYGILKYAVRMDLPEACTHLSNILLGISEGILSIEPSINCYELMLGIFPGNLQVYYGQSFNDEEMLVRRSDYLKKFLQYIEVSYS